MPTAVVTFNGRITLPPQIRKQLGLRTGDSVDFVEVEQGRFAISCRNRLTTDSDLRSSWPPETSVEPVTVS
jgi:AbrB family looped-hinge helix DNA binding protein